LANGEDYGDFVSSVPDCATNEAVQDAEGCPGRDAGFSILNDGGTGEAGHPAAINTVRGS
jgi:hypothetical protein